MRHFCIKRVVIFFVIFLTSCSSLKESQENGCEGQVKAVRSELNVLYIGSSFGVCTFIQFPALAASAGINITGLNLYSGGCTLKDVAEICKNDSEFENGAVYTYTTRKWQTSSKNIKEVLHNNKWDIVILQRAAPGKDGGCDQWTDEMASELNCIISYIKENSISIPTIYFVSGFSRSVGTLGNREKQLESVLAINSTAMQVYEQFGIDIIPSATAIHNARITGLSNVPTYNSCSFMIPDLTGEGDHLDTGIGSYILGCLLFEKICGGLYGLSIVNLSYIPTLTDVQNNAGGFSDSCFTQIDIEKAFIAKEIVLATVKDPWCINFDLAEEYTVI